MMKLHSLVAGAAFALCSAPSFAGQIILDKDGIAGGDTAFIESIGSSIGNMLIDGAINNGGAGSGKVFAHNSFGLTGFGIPGAELTFLLELDVTTAVTGTGVGAQLGLLLVPGGTATLKVFYDVSADASQNTGLGYGLGAGAVQILEGTASVDGTFAFSQTSAGTSGALAANNNTPSISGNGSVLLNIDFDQTKTNAAYVKNNIDSLIIDMRADNQLSLRFSATPNRASSSFNDGAVAPSFGSDGQNDFDCGGGPTATCDLQVQMSTTLTFNSVPEPATLGLVGMAAAMAGAGACFRRKSRA